MDIAIVNPRTNRPFGDLMAIEPPIWSALYAEYFRNDGSEVSIIDADPDMDAQDIFLEVERLNPSHVIVVAMGANPSASSTPKMPEVKEIINALSRTNRILAVSGLHPLALPEQTAKELGCAVGPPPSTEWLVRLEPAWDLLDMTKYRAHNWHCFGTKRDHYGVVYTSFNCPYNCSYCNIHAMYGKPGITYRRPLDVAQEIDKLVENYGMKNLKICDELFAVNQEHVKKLCALIGKHDLNIWAYARVDTINEKMLATMRQAGIRWLCYGFESVSDTVRERVSKKQTREYMKRAVDLTHNAGINIIGNFIFGLPGEMAASMQETLQWAKEYKLEYVNFYCAMAYPGSRLYDEAKLQGMQLPRGWSGYDQYHKNSLPLGNEYLTGKQVKEFRDKAFKEYFTDKTYLDMMKKKFGNKTVKEIKEMINGNS